MPATDQSEWRPVVLAAGLCATLVATACRTHPAEPAAGTGAGRGTSVGVPSSNLSSACVEAFDPAADYFPDKATLQHARLFTVTYHRHYKVVTLRAEVTSEGDSDVSDRMVLVQCGTPTPPLTGELEGAHLFSIPVMRVAANDNRDIAALAALEVAERLTAIGGEHVYNESIRRRWQQERRPVIGYAWDGMPNVEVLLTSPVDVLFMRRASLEQGRALARARALGIPAAPTLSHNERHYLGYTEWMKFFALFVNGERRASLAFDDVAAKTLEYSKAAASGRRRPKVIWAHYASGGFWSAARRPADHRHRYIIDAGGENVLEDPRALPGGLITTEEIIERARDADLWITEQVTTREWRLDLLRRIAAVRTGRVYHHQKRTDFSIPAYDWYELAVMRPDLVLRDLIALLHPELSRDHHELMFFAPVPLAGETQ
jgi:iron complex transport system substrate-binding protein